MTEKVHIVRIVPAWLSAIGLVMLVALGLYVRGAYVLAHRPASTAAVSASGSVAGIPPRYLDAYVKASARTGVAWSDLAAIGWSETHHGELLPGVTVDAAGFLTPAEAAKRWDNGAFSYGPMQIQDYNLGPHGQDGNGDGRIDVRDPMNLDDMVATAADILMAKGYATNPAQAIKGYNGSGPAADEYATRTTALAAQYRAQGSQVGFSVAVGASGSTVTPRSVLAYWAGSGLARWAKLAPSTGNRLDVVYAAADPAVRSLLTSAAGSRVNVAATATASATGDRIAAAARQWVGRDFRPGVREQCTYFVRQVLSDAGVSLTPAVTAHALDGYDETGVGFANSFGADQGQLVGRVQDLAPGDLVMFLDTYGDWKPLPGFPGVITHVGVYVGNGQIVDRPTATAPVQLRSVGTFKFAGAVRPRAGFAV